MLADQMLPYIYFKIKNIRMAAENTIKLIRPDLKESHAAFAVSAKRNFIEIEKILNKLSQDIASSTEVAASTNKFKILTLSATQAVGTTILSDGLNITKAPNKFIIQRTSTSAKLLHMLRQSASKSHASSYNFLINAALNQIELTFSVMPDEDLELILFGEI